MIEQELTLDEIKRLNNFLFTGYRGLICCPSDLELLSKEFPKLYFTPNYIVNEGCLLMYNNDDYYKHTFAWMGLPKKARVQYLK